MNKNVKIDREKYIGGSDIPIIMGISPFKSYYQLLKEKTGIESPEEIDNDFTRYGNVMEEKIRDYVNEFEETPYLEDTLIKGDIRCNVDGYNGNNIIEIKTTSKVKKKVKSYKYYLVQLLFYLMEYDKKQGILFVYERPKDFDCELDINRLQQFNINIDDYTDLIDEINQAIEKFRVDKKRLKENCLLGEEDFK